MNHFLVLLSGKLFSSQLENHEKLEGKLNSTSMIATKNTQPSGKQLEFDDSTCACRKTKIRLR